MTLDNQTTPNSRIQKWIRLNLSSCACDQVVWILTAFVSPLKRSDRGSVGSELLFANSAICGAIARCLGEPGGLDVD